jgi:negative regulator of sigma E activity
MNNEELDSQLSAMFDDELPAPECELLARRLARDEGLKARWGRYAAIGACIRAGHGEAAVPAGEAGTPSVRFHSNLAAQVSRAVAAEPALLVGAGRSKGLATPAMSRWWQPVAGGAVVAAGVAAAAILWLRAGSPDAPVVAQAPGRADLPIVARASPPASAPAAAARAVSGSAPADADSYVVPPPSDSSALAPPMELANFVVAHSEYSAPLLRRSVLTALIADESGGGDGVSAPLAGPVSGARSTSTAVGNGAAARARSRAVSTSRTLHANQAH